MKRVFILTAMALHLLAQQKPADAPKPIGLSDTHKVAVLTLQRDFESASKAKLIAERDWKQADETLTAAQEKFKTILADLQKQYKCENCSLDMASLTLNPPAKAATTEKK